MLKSAATPDTNRFVLLDPSILEARGHHCEYAVHVLEAARQLGYRPILATNRQYRSRDARWEVHPIYTHGFWMRLSPPWWYAPAITLKRWVNTRWARIYIVVAFSHWNLYRLLARDLSVYFRSGPTAARSWQVVPVVAWAYARTTASTAWQFVLALTPFRAYLKGVAAAGIAFVRALLLPLGRVLRPPLWLQRVLYDQRRASAFEHQTERLLSRLRLTDHDIVFLPTTSEIEMLGLGRILARWRSDARPSWHLVFRRDLGDGSFAEVLRGSDAYRPLRNAMFAFQELSKGHNISFYADTDLLTEQYNSLGILHFGSIPIPHTRSSAKPRQREQPLRVVYLGDARAEKGYHHLPRLIGDLWEPYVQRGDIAFAVQSNFNVPEGEPEAVIARGELEALSNDRVQLICSPLSTDAYAELLLSADLVVLPYDASRYYARSSGIAVEALAAGIPVVVPAGTWMALQFAEASNRHAENLTSRMRVLRSRESTRMRWRRHGEPRSAVQTDGEIIVSGEGSHAYAWIAAPPGTTHVLVCFECSPARIGDFIRVTTHQQTRDGLTLRRGIAVVGGAPRMAAVLPLHSEGGKVYLALRNAWSHQMLHIRNLAVHFMARAYLGRTPPLSAVGTVFAQPDELSAAVKEILDHYDHYRETARTHAQAILGLHNPRRLIAVLEKKPERRLQEVRT